MPIRIGPLKTNDAGASNDVMESLKSRRIERFQRYISHGIESHPTLVGIPPFYTITHDQVSNQSLDNMADNNNNNNNNAQQPGMIASHAQYVKGVAEVSLPMHLQPARDCH